MSFLVEIVMKHHVHDVINIIVIRGKSSVRPSYDGVLLLSHIRESIPILLRAVKNHSLEGRFRSVVAGMGDISAYLADHHRDKFHADNGQVDLGLYTPICLPGPASVTDQTEALAIGVILSY